MLEEPDQAFSRHSCWSLVRWFTAETRWRTEDQGGRECQQRARANEGERKPCHLREHTERQSQHDSTRGFGLREERLDCRADLTRGAAVHPNDADTVLIGYTDGAVYASHNAGEAWEKLDLPASRLYGVRLMSES